MPDEEPKIIIDESWKDRVQREKEEARQKVETEPAPAAEAPAEPGEQQASFVTLMSALVTETMLALGLIAQRDANEVYIDLEHAKFMIDTLIVLRTKTAGNLTPEEEGGLKEAITRLQSYYVAMVQHLQEQEMQRAGINLQDLQK